MRRSLLLALLAALAASAAPGAAAWLFVPHPARNQGFVELFASRESDDNRYGARDLRWDNSFLREKLTFESSGYSYDPRFMLYDLSLSGAFKQERYDVSSAAEPVWRNDTGLEYRVRALFLPTHSYNLELFALRYEPLYRQNSATERSNLFTSRGADFRYRKKPWFFRSHYTDNRVDSREASSSVERLGLDGEYFRLFAGGGQLSFNAAFNPSRFSNSNGLDGRSTDSLASSTVERGRLRLFSTVSHGTQDQSTRGDGDYSSRQFDWYERLTAQLPLHFRSDLGYRYDDGETRFRSTTGEPEHRLSNTGRDLDFDLVHKLYESLQSQYTYRDSARSSLGGTTDSFSHALAFTYSKSIPRGRLYAGITGSRGETESRGTNDVVDESHSGVAVPGSFTLDRTEIDPATIALFLKSPIAPYDTIQLEENVQYTVTALGASYEIRIFDLPPEVVIPGTYDFLVSYSLLGGDFRLRTDSFGHNASVELFGNLVAPYYSYVKIHSRVLSGSFPGTGLDSSTFTTGIRFLHGPWRGRVEYQDVSWEVSPYRSFRTEAQYFGALSASTNLYATLSHVERRYARGSSRLYVAGLRETFDSGSASVQQRLFRRALLLSLGGSLTRSRGLYETDAYSVDGSLSWRIGRIDLSSGASYYDSRSRGSLFATSRRDHYYLFFRLRRTFF